MNTGHGHVRQRDDRLVAQCGGPVACCDCRGEAADIAGMLVIALPAVTPSLNEILGWKHNPKMRAWKYRSYRDAVAFQLRGKLNEAGRFFTAPPDLRMLVIIERHCPGRGLDDMNLRGGCKPLVDALVAEHVLRDDTAEWLEDHYFAVPAPRGVHMTRLYIGPSLKPAPVNRAEVKRKRQGALELVSAPRITTLLGDVEF